MTVQFTVESIEAVLSLEKGYAIARVAGVMFPQEDIDAYAELCLDDQWIHTDPDRVAEEKPMGFEKTIVHGMFIAARAVGALSSAIDGGGFAAVHKSAKINFAKPVLVGSAVTYVCNVKQVRGVGGDSAVMLQVDVEAYLVDGSPEKVTSTTVGLLIGPPDAVAASDDD